METQKHTPNSFSWTDLATSDVDGAKAFYTAVFGWDLKDMPAGDAGTYSIALKGGKPVAGMFAMSPQMAQAGLPPHWQSYITVDDVDAMTKRVEELSGKVIQPPFDVMEEGRMAVVTDPQGAAFCLWQPKASIGARLVNEPGTLCWNELYAHDLEAAKAFYTALLGWTVHDQPGAMGQPYVVFRQGERSAAGMMQIQKEWGPMPPSWTVYFAVEDCDASLAKIEKTGGRAFMPPMEIESVGRFVMVADPQGAAFSVIALHQDQ